MLKELSDEELYAVNGSDGGTNIIDITIIYDQFNIVYAPVNVYGNVSHANIDNGNVYTQENSVRRGRR